VSNNNNNKTHTHTCVVRRPVTSIVVTVVGAVVELRRVGNNTVYRRAGNNCADTNKPPSISWTKTSTRASFACYGDVTRLFFRGSYNIHKRRVRIYRARWKHYTVWPIILWLVCSGSRPGEENPTAQCIRRNRYYFCCC